jgi:hypothetical protein
MTSLPVVGEDVIGKWARIWRTEGRFLFWDGNYRIGRTKERRAVI